MVCQKSESERELSCHLKEHLVYNPIRYCFQSCSIQYITSVQLHKPLCKCDYFSTHLPVLLHCILGQGLGLHDIGVIFFHLIKLSGLHEELKKMSKANFQVCICYKRNKCNKHTQSLTLYLSPSPLEWRKCLLISWVRIETGLSTWVWKNHQIIKNR